MTKCKLPSTKLSVYSMSGKASRAIEDDYNFAQSTGFLDLNLALKRKPYSEVFLGADNAVVSRSDRSYGEQGVTLIANAKIHSLNCFDISLKELPFACASASLSNRQLTFYTLFNNQPTSSSYHISITLSEW